MAATSKLELSLPLCVDKPPTWPGFEENSVIFSFPSNHRGRHDYSHCEQMKLREAEPCMQDGTATRMDLNPILLS